MSKPSLETTLQKELKQALLATNALTVAFSGGLDSTVLLHLCQRLKVQDSALIVNAVHVNHGISANALSWERHCQDMCDMWHIPIIIKRISLPTKRRTSLEQQARVARYAAIEQAVNPTHLTLLAQHQDDQAETYLLQLARGAGSEGLSAMPTQFTSNSGHVFLRPLLKVGRSQLYEYAKRWQLVWIEDESNQDERFYRNFVRRKIMPALHEKWPAIASTISRSAEHQAQSVAVVDEYMTFLSHDIVDKDGQLLIAPWLNLSQESQKAMLRFWLKTRVNDMPSTAVLAQISDLHRAKDDAQPQVKWGDNIVSRYAGKLYVRTKSLCKPHPAFEISLNNEVYSDDVLPYTIQRCQQHAPVSTHGCFELQSAFLRVEFGGFARVCKLTAKRPSKSIKKWLQEWQIPPWERANIPILLAGEQVLAVGKYIALSDANTQTGPSSFRVCVVLK
ncbi:tRNA lysidine(34) synthetase TilS [Glaciecola sp. SC05]|uniref:tRNA lysidine(34) synthetase TilS n=1 Tax=Glaciecola sp. SC05 TaxID=1987355 RepID=UPI0035287BEE